MHKYQQSDSNEYDTLIILYIFANARSMHFSSLNSSSAKTVVYRANVSKIMINQDRSE